MKLAQARRIPESPIIFGSCSDPRRNTPLVSRSRAGIARFFDGFTLVEPGMVTPVRRKPELHDPLRKRREDSGGEPVLRLVVPGP